MWTLFALLLSSGVAFAQPVVGPLQAQNDLSEIAAQGGPGQAAARVNIGIGSSSSPTFLNLAVTNNATIAGTLGVTGISTLGNNTTSIYNQTYYGPSSGVVGTSTLTNSGFSGNRALGSGGTLALAPYLFFSDAISGTPQSLNLSLATIQTTSDTLAAGAPGLGGLQVTMNSGGTGMSGNRQALGFQMNFSGSTLNSGSVGYYIIGLQGYTSVTGNNGGTSGAAFGNVMGGVTGAFLKSGATYYNLLTGHEFDVGVSSGAGAGTLEGVKIVNQNGSSLVGDAGHTPQVKDYGLAIASSNTNGFYNGISFGSADDAGAAPIYAAGAGALITTKAGSTGSFTVPNGIDFTGATFTGDAWRSAGSSIDPVGNAVFAKVTTPQLFTTSGDYLNLNTIRNLGFSLETSAASNSQIVVDVTTANSVKLQASGGTNTSMLFQAVGSGSVIVNSPFTLNSQTSAPGSSVGTLTNAPSASNPTFWLAVTINGAPHYIPAW